jgi:hypothetical protein
VRLFERELALQRHRNESKQQLARSPDFVKSRAFDNISRNKNLICMHELTRYLEKNGFYPRREDTEAILRRMDHDGDQAISYLDFCELTSMDANASSASPDKTSYSPPRAQGAQENIPVQTFNIKDEGGLTLKPKPVEAPKNISPAKLKQREDELKLANVERDKINAIIEEERNASIEANRVRNEERDAKIAADKADRDARIEQARLDREIAEQDRLKVIEDRKRQLQEERDIAEAERLQREADYQVKLEERRKEQEAAAAIKAEEDKARNITNFQFLRLLKALL